MCEYGPRGMAVTYRRAMSAAVPYRTRLTGRLICSRKRFRAGWISLKETRLATNEGFGATRRTPRHLRAQSFRAMRIQVGCCRLGLLPTWTVTDLDCYRLGLLPTWTNISAEL